MQRETAAGAMLTEAKQRSGLEANLAAAEAKALAVLPHVEAEGDAVWFQGELYREKIVDDKAKFLRGARAHMAARRRAKPAKADPFAPPGRPVALQTRVAQPPDFAPLRTA